MEALNPYGGPMSTTIHTAPQTAPSAAPVRKVVAATAGAGLGAATSDLVVGALGDLFNNGQPIPDYLSGWLVFVIPMVVAALSGYFVPRAPGE